MVGLCYVYYELILYVTYLEVVSMFTHLGFVFTCDDSFVSKMLFYTFVIRPVHFILHVY